MTYLCVVRCCRADQCIVADVSVSLFRYHATRVKNVSKQNETPRPNAEGCQTNYKHKSIFEVAKWRPIADDTHTANRRIYGR